MKIDDKGINLIKSFEGCKLVAYKCVPTEKYYTIGYGHYGADVKKGMKISKKQALDLLKKDIAKFEKSVNAYVKVDITQSMYNALVSFAYNCGANALKNSSLLKYVNKKEFAKAHNEFAKWNKSGGKVLKGLVNRRKKEQKEFKRMGYITDIPSLKGYKGFSIVQGLKSYGYESSFKYRTTLWKKIGKKTKYKGTALQNTQLLNYLKSR